MPPKTSTCMSVIWFGVLSAETFLYGSYSIIVNSSRENGKLPYLTSLCVLCTEALKLVISACLLVKDRGLKSCPTTDILKVFQFSVPALCYTINNNVCLYLQTQMDPATYMILSNFKLLTTAVLYRIIIRRTITSLQWLSLVLLTLGCAWNSSAALSSKGLSDIEVHTTWLGVHLLICYSFISGFAGVYTEYIFKKNFDDSMHYQNVFLYIFGVFFNFASWIVQYVQLPLIESAYPPIFHGFSIYTWTVIITETACGLIMALIMKHRSNMERIFVIALSPIVTTALSYFLFGLTLDTNFLFGASIVIVSIVLFHFSKLS